MSENTVVKEKDNVTPKEKFNWKKFWDKVTTGILILLLASPFLILAYIFLWFILR